MEPETSSPPQDDSVIEGQTDHENHQNESSSPTSSQVNTISPVLHLLVVGFHHKKGCQVEYSFPPLCPDSNSESHECPEAWKNLPSLAMPDGSHNFVEDTVYFHLPSLTEPGKTVYGVSSYRQIEAKMLSKKTADITRSTVQKSVCVLSNLPLYGHIQVKMGLITEAYFREGDFTQYMLLHDAFSNLNMCLNSNLLNSTQALIGLPLRELLQRFQHKTIILFKLLLLQKRVLFFHSPVRPLSTSILALLALIPGLVESGLHSATALAAEELEEKSEKLVEELEENAPAEETAQSLPNSESSSSLTMKLSAWKGKLTSSWTQQQQPATSTADAEATEEKTSRDPSFEDLGAAPITVTVTSDSNCDKSGRSSPLVAANLANEAVGLPLKLFGDGYLCHPYLSLPYLDLLGDSRVRGYVIGATNVLFKQKKSLFDVVVELDTGRIEIYDADLKRQLELTKEDMRFADHVVQERPNNFLSGIGWEGGDDWLRAEFKSYLLYMLRTSLMEEGSRELEEFNPGFIQAWKSTNAYAQWIETSHEAIMELHPGHLFSGQLSMNDVKLKLSQLTQTMQNTDKGRKITNAAASTSRAVAQTSKAVGGVLSQAKGALSQWWNAIHPVETSEAAEMGEEALNGMRMSEIDLSSSDGE